MTTTEATTTEPDDLHPTWGMPDGVGWAESWPGSDETTLYRATIRRDGTETSWTGFPAAGLMAERFAEPVTLHLGTCAETTGGRSPPASSSGSLRMIPGPNCRWISPSPTPKVSPSKSRTARSTARSR